MSTDPNQVTTVRIHNRTYQVRSSDPNYVKELAQYVDTTMTGVFENTPAVDSLKVAVLAALNIADDYFSAKQELESMEQSVKLKSEKINVLLDPFLRVESS